MDRVRFGRALGYGARHAAKTLMSAAEAANAPNPAGSTAAARRAPAPAAQQQRPAAAQTRPASRRPNVAAHAGRSFLSPVKKFSSTVLQQVLGTLFALFAFVFGSAMWKLRSAFAGPYTSSEAHRLYLAVIMFALFAYFTISSFVKASRAERR